MSYQRSREMYAKRFEATGRKRKMSITKTRSAVNTRSMTAIAGTTDNGQMVDVDDSLNNSVISDYEETMDNISLISELKNIKLILKQQNEKLKIMSQENSYLKVKLDKTEQHCIKFNIKKKEPLNELPCTPVSSTCSSGTMDLNLEELNPAESNKQQIVESMKHKSSHSDIQSTSCLNPIEPIPNKQHKIKKKSSRPRNLGKMREFIVVTENGGYYTCLGDFDPNEDRDLCYKNRELKLPSWRVKLFSNGFTMDAADICNETIAQTQYNSKCEKSEQKRKRWDLQRARELRQIDYLKEGRYKNSFQNSRNENTEQDMRSLLPNPDGIDVVRVTENLPVSAFGCNLHVKKNAGLYKFHYSQWCNDGTDPPQEDNEQYVSSLGGKRTQCKVQ